MPAKLTLAAMALLLVTSGHAEQPQPQTRSPGAADIPARHLAAIERASGGRIGVVLLDARGRTLFAHRPNERFAMCSTFKLPLAAMFADGSDRSPLPITRRRSDGKFALFGAGGHRGGDERRGRGRAYRHRKRQCRRQSAAAPARRARRLYQPPARVGRRGDPARPARTGAERKCAQRSARHHQPCRHGRHHAAPGDGQPSRDPGARASSRLDARDPHRPAPASAPACPPAGRWATRPAPAAPPSTTSPSSARREAANTSSPSISTGRRSAMRRRRRRIADVARLAADLVG